MIRDRQTWSRVLAGLLVGVAVVHVGSLIPRVVTLTRAVPVAARFIVGGYAGSAFTALLACALAGFLVWKAADRPAARTLALFLAFLAVFWGSLFRFVDMAAEADGLSVGLTYSSNWVGLSAIFAFIFAVAAFLRFAARFPRPLDEQSLPQVRRFRFLRRIRIATLRPVPVWSTAAALFLGVALLPELLAFVMDAGPDMSPRKAAFMTNANLVVIAFAYVLVPLAAIPVGIRNLLSGYRQANAEERKRMMWIVVGFSAAAWMIGTAIVVILLVGALDLPNMVAIAVPVLVVLAPLLIVVGSAMGVLYSGAIDPALTLQRSTVYGVLAAIAVAGFAGLENALSSLIEDRLGLPGFTGSVVAGALVAATLIPIRRPLQRLISRRFHPAE